MEHEYELHLEQIPIHYGSKRMALDNPELTIHKFTTLDEAVLTLALIDPVEFQIDIAIKREHDYHIRNAYVYNKSRESPIISLEHYNKMMQQIPPASSSKEFTIYALHGDFSELSKNVSVMLFDQIHPQRDHNTVLLSSYDPRRDRMSLSEFGERKEAAHYLSSVLHTDTSFDYVKIAFHTDRPGYERGVNVTIKVRHHDFVDALVHLLKEHFMSDGKIAPVNSSEEDEFCCISRASNGMPVVDIQGSPVSNPLATGSLRLHFEDKGFMSTAFKDYPALRILANSASEYIPLAHSSSGQYWDNVALKRTMKFLSADKNAIVKAVKQKLRTPTRGNKGGLSR